jgi:excisionase family DNA binding protein
MTTADQQLLSFEQAAGLLGISLRTLDRLTARGELHVVRVGRARRIRLIDLDVFAAGTGSASDEEPEAA